MLYQTNVDYCGSSRQNNIAYFILDILLMSLSNTSKCLISQMEMSLFE